MTSAIPVLCSFQLSNEANWKPGGGGGGGGGGYSHIWAI